MSKKRPLTAAEKKTAADACNQIEYAVSTHPRLAGLLATATKMCHAEFQNADIGRWHVIEGFVSGHRGDISLGDLHRQYDGYMHAVVAGAGFRQEYPEFDATRIHELFEEVKRQRSDWRARA